MIHSRKCPIDPSKYRPNHLILDPILSVLSDPRFYIPYDTMISTRLAKHLTSNYILDAGNRINFNFCFSLGKLRFVGDSRAKLSP